MEQVEADVKTETLQDKDREYLIHPMTALRDHEANGPLVIVKGDGVMLYDSDGNQYIDSLAGLWNCCLGHGRRDVIDAVTEQMERLAFVTTFYGVSNDTTIAWAERLARHLPGHLKRVFPNVTGSEADDTAFKFARMYWGLIGRSTKIKVFSHHRAYHGVSTGVLGATGMSDFWKRYMPLNANHVHVPAPYCFRCPYDDTYPSCDVRCARVLEQMLIAEDPATVAAFIAEPVIGGGGLIIPPPEYYRRVREICDRHEVLFIADEIITGFGRTGKWFAIEHSGVVPDMLTMGKGMTAGYVPMFAVAVSENIYRVLVDSGEVLYHGFTYTGQPVLSAAALKVIEVLEAENLIERVNEMGKVLAEHLRELSEHPWVGDVRSIGLLGGVEFVADKATREPFAPDKMFAARLGAALRRHGVLGRVLKGDTLGFCPPFTISVEEMAAMFGAVRRALDELRPI